MSVTYCGYDGLLSHALCQCQLNVSINTKTKKTVGTVPIYTGQIVEIGKQ